VHHQDYGHNKNRSDMRIPQAMMSWHFKDIAYLSREAKAAGFHADLIEPANRMVEAMRALQDTLETGDDGHDGHDQDKEEDR
jgi:3-hydroxyisobutyrate dehydrogenase-like beta-hydroxyacid dehydrogenase